MAHINIEIKAKCTEHEKVRKILQENSAEYRGLDHQVDTYFNVAQGRLKCSKIFHMSETFCV